MRLTNKFLRRLALAALASVAALASMPARARDAFSVYASSLYGFCDAKKVARVWKTDVGQAKSIIGTKIEHNLTQLIDRDIASTAHTVRCDWSEAELSYRDATALAKFWKVSIPEAKASVADKMSSSGAKAFKVTFRDVLRR